MFTPSKSSTQKPSFKNAGERMFAGADKLLFQRAGELPKSLTQAEEIVWSYLRNKPFGYKFRRQHPYLNYILDFYCHALKLAIEIDGPIHQKDDRKRNDKARQDMLEKHGIAVLRFTNEEVIDALEEVVKKLDTHFTNIRLHEAGKQ